MTLEPLVFHAVVEAIDCAPLGIRGAFLDWIVRARVEEIVSGTFDGARFDFRVHSPSRAGLEVGARYAIKATPVAGGYRVHEEDVRRMP